MITFCPWCANVLLIKRKDGLDNVLSCQTCPYIYSMSERKQVDVKYFDVKEVDDILGGKAAWENVDKTDATCPNSKCGFKKAFFFTMQIRSADEPTTIFFKCCQCGYRWNE